MSRWQVRSFAPASSPAASVHAATATAPLSGRQWLVSLALVAPASLGAVVTQLTSKRGASAALDTSGAGHVAYAAGWPLAYARFDASQLSTAAWARAVDGPPPVASVAWPAFVADVVLLAIFFAAGLALVAALWWLVVRQRSAVPARQMGQAVITGLAVAASWDVISASVITIISQNVAPDDATRSAITQPRALVALLPGVAGYGVQRWFESDAGPAIATTGGAALVVESLATLALAVALPAALFTLIALGVWRHRKSGTPPATHASSD